MSNELVRELVEALEANHRWHQDYEEYGGYADSALANKNSTALAKARAYLASGGWLDMAKAPKDRRILVLSSGGTQYTAEWAQNPETGSELYRIANVGDAEGHQIFVNEPVAWQDLPENLQKEQQ